MTDPNLVERLQQIEDSVNPRIIGEWRRRASKEYMDAINQGDVKGTYQDYIDGRVVTLYDEMTQLSSGLTPLDCQGNMQLWEEE